MPLADQAARRALEAALRQGPAGASALSAASGFSDRQLLRVLAEHSDLVAAGRARRRRYALRQPVRGAKDPRPVYAVDTQGRVSDRAAFSLLQPRGSHCDLAPGWPVADAARDGWWDGLPYPFYDMQPQGYLGRLLARELRDLLDVAPDPGNWDDETIAHVLSRRGDDCSGNLIVGEVSLRRWQERRVQEAPAVPEAGLAAHYVARAVHSASQGVAGSSAGGEFPKFTTRRTGTGEPATPHVIVKFSGVAEGLATQRWPDLLVCEHLALVHAGSLPGVTASSTRVLQAGGRTFLESERFDRLGDQGRRALVSLQSASAHLLGLAAHDWPAHADALARAGWLGEADAQAVHRLWWFGRLIANTDMHQGNLAFFCDAGRFSLAPVFDMLPMAYAPLAGGEVPPPQAWQAPMPTPSAREPWLDAAQAASRFWQAASQDMRISTAMRAVCGANADLLERTRRNL